MSHCTVAVAFYYWGIGLDAETWSCLRLLLLRSVNTPIGKLRVWRLVWCVRHVICVNNETSNLSLAMFCLSLTSVVCCVVLSSCDFLLFFPCVLLCHCVTSLSLSLSLPKSSFSLERSSFFISIWSKVKEFAETHCCCLLFEVRWSLRGGQVLVCVQVQEEFNLCINRTLAN